jgi:DNA transformation protein
VKAISDKQESNISLKSLTNIGSVLAQLLYNSGIETPSQLYDTGAIEAFIRIRAIDQEACFCKLCALEGAVQGIRWHNLAPAKKAELRHLFDLISK